MEIITILDNLNYVIKLAKERGEEDIAKNCANIKSSIEKIHEDKIIEIKKKWLDEIEKC